jgi:hypothetical protein
MIVIDSGAGVHITPNAAFISNLRPLRQTVELKGVFGHPQVATHFGEGAIPIGSYTLHVPQIIHMPSIKDTLLSYVQLTRAGHHIRVEGGTGMFTDKDNTAQLRLSGSGNILTFENGSTDAPPAATRVNAVTRAAAAMPSSSPPSTNIRNQKAGTAAEPPPSAIDEAQIVHARYGHICARKLVQLAKHGGTQMKSSGLTRVGAGNKVKLNFCEQKCDACRFGKMARLKFAQEIEHHATRPNDKVVADVCGPIWTVKNADETSTKYYLSTITDVYSRHLEILIVESKDQASDHCISYLHASRISTRNDMRHFHTDGGTEYNRFEKVATSRGTKVTRTPIHTPQRNGIAERKNRTIMEMARALLYHANLPVEKYWRYAVETAVVIHNRCTIVNEHGKTMHELFTGHAPELSFMRVFGCDAYVRVVDPKTKLAPRSEKGIFLGYDVKREYCYRVKVRDTIVVSRDVRFAESDFTVDRTKTTTQDSNTVADSSGESKHNRKVRTRAELEDNQADARTKNSPSIMHLGGDAMHSSADTHRTHSKLEPDASAAVISDATETSLTDEHPLDQRTNKRLKHAIAHEQQSQSHPSRYPSRARTSTRQTGLNLSDFGYAAFNVSVSPALVQSSLLSNVSSSVQQKFSSSTAEHSPDTIPQSKIRVADVPIPSTVKAAKKSLFASFWRAAMVAEHASIVQHNTFELVPLPHPAPNLVSSRWVFAVKEKDGFVVRFKARLVARGFTQQHGVDYEQTYSPVLKYKTLRIILTLVVRYGWRLEIMDVQTAYLHAELKEIVYMQQPEGFEQHDTQRANGGNTIRPLVCLLKKALYGLKQAGREWNIHLDEFVRSLGFKRCVSDTCLYVKTSRTGRPFLLSVYVDDIPSAYAIEDEKEWEEIKAAFFRRFKIAFQADADWVLNMRITRDNTGHRLVLDQQAYIEQILEDFSMDECKSVSHPGAQEELFTTSDNITAATHSSQLDQTELHAFPYRRAIGLLMYLSNTSRPDITHAVNVVSRFVERPNLSHVRAVKQILRYLSGTRQHGLLFAWDGRDDPASPLALVGYADANWAGCLETRRSTTGTVITLGGSIVDWASKRQKTAALSSCEAEYMSVASTLQSIMWLQSILGEIGFTEVDSSHSQSHTHATRTSSSLVTRTPTLFNDNQSTIAMSTNDVYHQRTKHIDLRYHFVREAVAAEKVRLEWCTTREQLADILTKALSPSLYIRIRDVLVFTRESALESKQN